MPISSIARRGDHVDDDEAPQRADADEERAGAAGRADVAERLAGERLAAHHREHADHAGDDRDERADAERGLDRVAAEEARARRSAATDAALTRRPLVLETAAVAAAAAVPRELSLAGAGDDQHAVVDVQHVDVVAVELAEHVGADDLVGACRSPPGPPAR